MKYGATLLVVKDMEISKKFYQDVLGLDVVEDFGANVTLSGGISLQTLESWKEFIGKDVSFGGNDGELYFVEDDLDAFLRQLQGKSVRLIHPLKTHAWGQRVVRFSDPDGHLIEVGEPLSAVAKRFQTEGMDEPTIAKRMDVPLSLVVSLLK